MFRVLRLNRMKELSRQRQWPEVRKITDGLIKYIKGTPHRKATPQVVREVEELRRMRALARMQRRVIAFVPTMGALHEGHLSMIRHAAQFNDEVYVSIYVNPTQFGQNEDLSTYPKTFERDLNALSNTNERLEQEQVQGRVTTLFYPTNREMYPGLAPSSEVNGDGSFVTITPLGKMFEGAARPVFFRGVATVCMKLLNIVQPEDVYFGQKDIQQCVIINRMIQDFHIRTRLRIHPTSREPDGLALSSRNVYLGARRRAVANVLVRAVQAGQQAYFDGKPSRLGIVKSAWEVLSETLEAQTRLPPAKRALFDVDYLSLARPDNLQEVRSSLGGRAAILHGAIKMLPLEEPQEDEDTGLGGGKTSVRLLDNAILRAPSQSLGDISLGA